MSLFCRRFRYVCRRLTFFNGLKVNDSSIRPISYGILFCFRILRSYRRIYSELAIQVFVPAGELPAFSSLDFWRFATQINLNVLLDIDYRISLKSSVLAPCECYSRILFGRFRICRIVRYLDVFKFLLRDRKSVV